MESDSVYRTAITRLVADDAERELLEETISEWKRGCNLAVESSWGRSDLRSRSVQSRAYDTTRERTALKSQHAVLATHHAAEAMRSCVEQQPPEVASAPSFTAPTIRYDSRTMTVFEDGTVSLTTVESRVRCPLALPEEEDGYQQQFLHSDEWTLAESSLTVRDGDLFLHIGFSRPVPEPEPAAGDGAVLGVDFGVENLAVTSTAAFFSGSELRHRRREFERIRKRLQQRGTRNARRTLNRVAGRERRYARDVLHRVANGILAEARRYDCTVIAFEKLGGIRDRVGAVGFFHRWAFEQLRTFVTYRATEAGIRVVSVDPENTSLECADCTHVAATNRPTRAQFVCQRCGSSSNADYNAAKNIALRHVRRDHQSSRGTGASRCALKSGTVTPTGEFIAYPSGFEAEFVDKSADA
ncbi:RNA-guided endonuclease InsQ/TnpB family protein [Haloarcula sp. GH36]|uniref:RNA-guided endonuclease InsQ/TnpB family protein n=1 Tax=Haloarcula montana TaxID=3111776 RepID=UPI002D7A1C2A|nr:transposase [Haloarcula sp. GH36]